MQVIYLCKIIWAWRKNMEIYLRSSFKSLYEEKGKVR